MTTHDKMTTDYLWLKDHSAADSKVAIRLIISKHDDLHNNCDLIKFVLSLQNPRLQLPVLPCSKQKRKTRNDLEVQ